MAKITLDNIVSGFSLSKINANFQKIATELNNKVWYRDNPTGESNTPTWDVDMNGKRVYNLPAPVLMSEPVRLQDLKSKTPDSSLSIALATSMGAGLVGFAQSGIGAVSQTVERKLGEWRSFYDYGAFGDGVVDDTAACQRMLDSGFNLVQMDGTFKISAPLVRTTTMKAAFFGDAKIVVAPSTNPSNALSITGADVHLYRPRIEGVCSSEILKITGARPVVIDANLDGQNGSKYGLFLTDPASGKIDRPTIKNILGPSTVYSGVGLYASGNVDKLHIIQPDISNIIAPNLGAIGASEGAARGINIQTTLATGYVKITGGRLDRIVGREGDAINLQSSALNDNFLLIVDGTVINDFNRRAIKAQCGEARIRGVDAKIVSLAQVDIPVGHACIETFGPKTSISNCDLDARYFDFGIGISGATKGTIHGNTIVNGTNRSTDPEWAGRSTQLGVRISGSSKVKVQRNQITGGVMGVRFLTCLDCSAVNNALYGQRDYGIVQESDSPRLVVNDNLIYDEGGLVAAYGVWMKGVGGSAERNKAVLSNTALVSQIVRLEATTSAALARNNVANSDAIVGITNNGTGNLVEGNTNIGTGGSGVQSLVANVGDADRTAGRGSRFTIVYNSVISANRVVNVNTISPSVNDVLRVTRATASTGAFTVTVGGLKALSTGQWCELTYDGAAWALSAFGSL